LDVYKFLDTNFPLQKLRKSCTCQSVCPSVRPVLQLRTSTVATLINVKFSLCLTKHHDLKTCSCGGVPPRIFDFGTRTRWVVSFTPRGKSPRYP